MRDWKTMPELEVLEVRLCRHIPDPWGRSRMESTRVLPPDGDAMPADLLPHGLLLRGKTQVFVPWTSVDYLLVKEKEEGEERPRAASGKFVKQK